MGAGIGIMIGKKQSKDNYYIDENTLYHYNRIRVGEDKLLSHILKVLMLQEVFWIALLKMVFQHLNVL